VYSPSSDAIFRSLVGVERIDPGGAQWAEGDSAGEHSAGSAELFGFCQGCDWAMNFGGMILGSGRKNYPLVI